MRRYSMTPNAATNVADTTSTFSRLVSRFQLGSPSAAVSAAPPNTQKNSIVRSAALDSIDVSPRRNPTAYPSTRTMKKTKNAQRMGCGPGITRLGPNRATSHQMNNRKPTTSAGRPRSVIPGMMNRAGMSASKTYMILRSTPASMYVGRRRVIYVCAATSDGSRSDSRTVLVVTWFVPCQRGCTFAGRCGISPRSTSVAPAYPRLPATW